MRDEKHSARHFAGLLLFDEPGTLDTARQTSRSLLLPPEAEASTGPGRVTARGAKESSGARVLRP